MPWSHCQREEILDSEACPECGVTKEQWTVEFSVTREFRVPRAPSLRIFLVDAQDEGVAGEPYRVELPDGEVVEGELDEEGFARVSHSQTGDCTIAFPQRAPGSVVLQRDDEEDEEPHDQEAEGEGETEEEPTAATFTLPARQRHQFSLRPHALRLTLKTPAGEPLCEARFELRIEGEEPLEGELDGEGRLEAPLPAGATEGELRVWQGDVLALEARVQLRAPDSVDALTGGQARLAKLGFAPGALDGELGPRMQSVLRGFQRAHGLAVTGDYDAATKDKLRELAPH